MVYELGELNFASGYFSDGVGVEAMFLLEDACLEGLGGVVGKDGDAGLLEDGAFVVNCVDKMDSCPGLAFGCGDDCFV